MDFNRLFPEQFRAFFNGPLSFCVERFGGIDSISLLDTREFGGKIYVDRFPFPWMRRKGNGSMGRPMYSPAIQFRHGKELYYPVDAEIYPGGFLTDSYSMMMRQNAAIFRFKIQPGETFSVNFSTLHMREGLFPTLKNQCSKVASGIQWLPAELRGPGFDETKPFPETEMNFCERSWQTGTNYIVFSAKCKFVDYEKNVFWAVKFPFGITPKDIPNGLEISAVAEIPVFEMGFGFADSREDALKNAEIPFADVLKEQKECCKPALELEIEGLPAASDFIKAYPGFQRSLLIAETDQEMAIRAAADKFGFFALWDHIYPSRDFLVLGEAERTKKALRYLIQYPWSETCPWITLQLVIQTNEYLAYTGDLDFLKESMPRFKEFFRFKLGFTDPVTGLLSTSLNVGVDNSKEAGLQGLFQACCLNGWWFNFLRVMENFASETGEPELAEECRKYADLVEKNYKKAFYCEKEKYLRAAINPDGSIPAIQIYQNTHTLAMDYAHGPWLFRNIVRDLATYQAERLYHPCGHTAVAPDSQVPCEMWKSVHMNQHNGHECKTARFGGRPEEAFRVMDAYLSYFKRYGTAVETFNLSGCDGDAHQLSNWQAFSATAATQALICGIAGWMIHRGGLYWVPGDGPDSRIRNWNGKTVAVSGKGSYASGLNGVPGFLQTPADIARTDWCVERTQDLPEYPVLVCAIDLPIRNAGINESGDGIVFTAGASRRTPVKALSKQRPVVLLNGAGIPSEWNPEEQTVWFDHLFAEGDICEIRVLPDPT